MKKRFLTITISLLTLITLSINPVFAAKPDKVYQGAKKANKTIPKEGRKGPVKAEKSITRDVDKEDKKLKKQARKDNKEEHSPSGIEKQREKKSEQVQKELGKGSEQGQTSREERRKWWKFWE